MGGIRLQGKLSGNTTQAQAETGGGGGAGGDCRRRAEWVIERVAAIDVVKAAGNVCVGGSFTTRCRRRALRCSWSCPGCDECAGPAQDKLDAVSLAKLTEKGLLRSSFRGLRRRS
ncbi:hypothetical protein [Mycobacterium riyadhense]|uniref:hypothetical protein n=1 Tax=Mycobacterium riyadhense TaxID=486698 RepID=UPI001950A547|nr:hypothetical protein [Mycobacterium riyadhense]